MLRCPASTALLPVRAGTHLLRAREQPRRRGEYWTTGRLSPAFSAGTDTSASQSVLAISSSQERFVDKASGAEPSTDGSSLYVTNRLQRPAACVEPHRMRDFYRRPPRSCEGSAATAE